MLETVNIPSFIASKVAIQVEEDGASSTAGAAGPTATAAEAAKRFAEDKTRRRVLQSFGWAIASVPEPKWSSAAGNDHAKIHIVVDAVNAALGGGKEAAGGHHHHSGCGCSH